MYHVEKFAQKVVAGSRKKQTFFLPALCCFMPFCVITIEWNHFNASRWVFHATNEWFTMSIDWRSASSCAQIKFWLTRKFNLMARMRLVSAFASKLNPREKSGWNFLPGNLIKWNSVCTEEKPETPQLTSELASPWSVQTSSTSHPSAACNQGLSTVMSGGATNGRKNFGSSNKMRTKKKLFN